MNDNFAIQIVFNEEYIDTSLPETDENRIKLKPRVLVLTAVDEPRISASNTITTHPIVSGDMVADHSYKNPATLSFNGTAAAFGNKGILVDSNEITLADLETLFMQLKDKAYLCNIVKLNLANKDDIRFSVHEYMVLKDITFTEKINTLEYSLTFQQVLLASVQTNDVDLSDEFLPNITEPITTSFTNALIDWEQIDAMVITTLEDSGLMTFGFKDFLIGLGSAVLAEIVGGAVGLIVATAIAKSLAAIGASIVPVGTVIVAAIGATVGFIAGFVKIIKKIQKERKYAIETFEKYKDDRKNQQEVERFCTFISDIHKQLEELNNVIHIYQIASDEDQECVVSISNLYYIFTFETNNTTKKRICKITSDFASVNIEIPDVSSSPSNYNSCTVQNALFRAAETGAYVHMINPVTDGQFKLSNCFIIVSDINPEDYTKAVEEIILNAITL